MDVPIDVTIEQLFQTVITSADERTLSDVLTEFAKTHGCDEKIMIPEIKQKLIRKLTS